MHRTWLDMALIVIILSMALAFMRTPLTVTALEFVDHFNNTDNWTFYRAHDSKNGMIENTQFSPPAPEPPSLKLPPAGTLQPDPPGFGDND